DIELADVDLDEIRYIARRALQFDRMANDIEHAAALDAGGHVFTEELDRHFHGYDAVLADAQEVDMHNEIPHGIELVFLGKHLDLLAINLDGKHGRHEAAGMDLQGDVLARKRDRQRWLLVAVDDGGNLAVAPKMPGGPLTDPFARLGRELIGGLAH